MEITSVTDDTITGSYTTAVSTKGCAKGKFQLVGRTTPPKNKNQVVAFTVAWKNDQSDCNSVTAWSGSYDDKNAKITAFWLLTSGVSNEQSWDSTLVGEDTFTRKAIPETEFTVADSDLAKHPSHP
jgi:hypothetical protein